MTEDGTLRRSVGLLCPKCKRASTYNSSLNDFGDWERERNYRPTIRITCLKQDCLHVWDMPYKDYKESYYLQNSLERFKTKW